MATATGDGEAQAGGGALRLAWRRLLTSIAAERTLVIAVDDAHWADGEFLELLEDSAATLNDHPILFLCTARPELLAQRPGFAEDGIRVEIQPLRPEASLELAASLLADGGDRDLARQVAEQSGGNPFFAEEIVCSLESGDGQGGRLPDTVQGAIASRLDGLPAAQKRVLQHAAVLGDRFRLGPLASLLEAEPEAELALLTARSLVDDLSASDGPGLFSFRHQLIRDVAYESLPRTDRTRLHERAAAGIGLDAVEHHPELAEVIAFHLMQAAEFEPTDGRNVAAFAAACEASTRAARRGAAPRAQELLEQAARIAPSVEQQIEALSEAAEIAMMRARGDEAYRLLKAAGEVAEGADSLELAAAKYALAIEVPTRSGGISGYTAEAELPALLEHCRELVPDPGPALKAQLFLDEAWSSWRFGRESEMGAPAREALGLARTSDDVRLLSSALDAVSATSQNEGKLHESVALARERLDALARVEDEGFFVYERHDAMLMLSEGLGRTGELRSAVEEERSIAPELMRYAPHRAYAKTLFPLFHLGEWDQAIEYGMSIRSNWLDQGRPPFAPLAGDVAVVGFLHGVRDDEPAANDWFAFAEEMALESRPLCGVRLFQADLALYRGDPAGALALLESRDPDFWWLGQIAVKRADVLASMNRDDAEAALAGAERQPSDDPLDAAVLLRARGIREHDSRYLLEACAILDRHGYVFEAARTRWLMGGEPRNEAMPVLEGLGAVPPADLGL